ncbi:MAG: CBS domain-containing protein [Bacteriovoracaceae bacterium]|jgi:CBS domain-containing protein
MKAKDFMTKNVITCTEDQSVAEAAKLMVEKEFSVMPILNKEGKLVGIVTESDFVGKEVSVPHALASIKQLFGQNFYFADVETLYADAKNKTLSSVMSKNLKTVTPETSLSEVVNYMISKNIKRLPVVDGENLVGIITRKNILKAFDATEASH